MREIYIDFNATEDGDGTMERPYRSLDDVKFDERYGVKFWFRQLPQWEVVTGEIEFSGYGEVCEENETKAQPGIEPG